MKLYFLRHGLAGERSEWTGDDFDRPLTREGKKRMAREAVRMKALKLNVEYIVSSPLVRAHQTAEIVARRLGLLDKLLDEELLEPGFDVKDLKEILKSHAAAEAVMLVGHEPDFSATISCIIGGGRITFKKGGLACVALPDHTTLTGNLVWLIPPAVLVD
jgi:phosphohistidine phosphatase